MSDQSRTLEVVPSGMLTRFITASNEFSKSTEQVHPALFIPYSLVVLSVNRLDDVSDEFTWRIGCQVAELRNKTLYGRADIVAEACLEQKLTFVHDPVVAQVPGHIDNPHHFNVCGFPEKKEEQKLIALRLASKASKRIAPPATHNKIATS